MTESPPDIRQMFQASMEASADAPEAIKEETIDSDEEELLAVAEEKRYLALANLGRIWEGTID
eukprot:8590746-Karenia_brevis.AAC.1